VNTSMGYLAPLLSFVLLAGCGFVREVHDPIRTYVLEIEGGDGGEESRIASDVQSQLSLLIGVPQPAPGFESSRMVYVQVQHELNYFATSQWVESPARMLTPLLVQRLEHSRMWRSVIPMPTSIRGDYRLDLTHVVLLQEFLQQPSRVRLALRSQLVNIRDRQVRGTRNFVREEEALTEDAYGGVLAAQRAVKSLLNDLMEWLVGCLQKDSPAQC
jgi:cholesterol transport system auxiliary component